VMSYGASSAIAKQIGQGAPADLFISADLDWMNDLDGKKLIKSGTRINLLGNHLVLIAPQGTAQPVEIKAGFDLASLVGSGKLAIADVQAVPAGKYAKAALEKLGLWGGVADKLAMTENVRAALQLVARGEAPFGIVYRSDAQADPKVSVIGTFPDGSHPPIIYPVAITAASSNADAAELLAFLRSDQAKALFTQQGFVVLP
jgi:molybdate transport system substrate-binding protein